MSTPLSFIETAVRTPKWSLSVDTFCLNKQNLKRIEDAAVRSAIWCRELESVEAGNPALAFLRELQNSNHYFAALSSLGLYKPAASCIRVIVESALYYTYFRTHSSELSTLVRVDSFYVSKKDILKFHSIHCPRFSELQAKFGFVSKLEAWYSLVSSIVHGQLPGTWTTASCLNEHTFDAKTLEASINLYAAGEQLVHELFLITLTNECWGFFSSPAKKELIKGISGDKKSLLAIDAA